MKKFFSLAGIVALTAIISTGAYAGNKETTTPPNPVDQQQSFYDNTATLRATLAADQAELDALMVGDNPDPKRARALSESISKSQDELRRQAGSYATPKMGHGGSHMAMNGYDHKGQDPHMNGCGCM